jgi:uncharacterized protein (TIGR03000 family)
VYSLVLVTALTAGTTAPDWGGYGYGYSTAPCCTYPPAPCYDYSCCGPRRYRPCYDLPYWKPGCPLYNVFIRPWKACFCPPPPKPCCPPWGCPDPFCGGMPMCPPPVVVWVGPPMPCDGPMMPGQKKMEEEKKEEKKKKKKKKKEDDDDISAVTILAPREAEVTFNGMKIARKDEKQSFATPKLKGGEKFHYVVTASVTVGGKKETMTRTVVVEAGKKAEVDFRELELALAKK